MVWQSIIDSASGGSYALTLSMMITVMAALNFGAWAYAWGFPEKLFRDGQLNIVVSLGWLKVRHYCGFKSTSACNVITALNCGA